MKYQRLSFALRKSSSDAVRRGHLMDCVRMMNSANDRFDETVRMNIEPRFAASILCRLERADKRIVASRSRAGVLKSGPAQTCGALRQEGHVNRVWLVRMQPSVRRAMFIEGGYEGCSPPSGGSCLPSIMPRVNQ